MVRSHPSIPLIGVRLILLSFILVNGHAQSQDGYGQQTTNPPTETPTTYAPTTVTPTTYAPPTETPTTYAPTYIPPGPNPTQGPNPTECPTYSRDAPLHPSLPPAGRVPYSRTHYLNGTDRLNGTDPFNVTLRTFSEHLNAFILLQPQAYAEFVNEGRTKYQQNGYYIDPKKVPADSGPVSSNDSCYSCLYYPNGYSAAGYDQSGDDPQGYNEAGYDRDGYSRYGREANSSYSPLCKFANPDYVNQSCILDNNGKPYTTEQGEILRYDQQGYDQYGNDQYGNPKPAPCNLTNPQSPPNTSYTPLPQTGIQCESASEEIQPDGSIIYIRKSATAMSVDDWRHFREAWKTVNEQGVIGHLQTVHAGNFQHHMTLRFAPWHREFVARAEDYLHRVDPCVFLPYWDFVAYPAFPSGIAVGIEPNFPPDVKQVAADGTVTSTAAVTRGLMTGILPNAGIVSAALSSSDFPTFSHRVELIHDSVHVWVGGSMNFVMFSPRDPIFYLHHANIDRLWAQWQGTNPTEPKADIRDTIGNLNFGVDDTKSFESLIHTLNINTTRGAGFKYI